MFSIAGQLATRHYYDRHLRREAVKILPGEYYLTQQSQKLLVTVLGGCVAVCLYDPQQNLVGINHFMWVESSSYAQEMMQFLLDNLLKHGAAPQQLEAKVFGAAHCAPSTVNSQKNAEFALKFLEEKHIPVVAQDLYESFPRKIYVFAENARVRVKRLHHLNNLTLLEREEKYYARLKELSALQ